MKLTIEKFAKIKKAEIELDGITVVTGYNDTGKSTIGKILYSMFNSLKSVDSSVNNKRRSDISKICDEITEAVCGRESIIYQEGEDGNQDVIFVDDILSKEILGFQGDLTIDEYKRIVNYVFSKLLTADELNEKKMEIDNYIESSYSKISAIKNTPDEELYKVIVERYFSNIFYSQINNCYYPDNDARVSLNIKDKIIDITFKNNKCSKIDLPLKILHEAFLIDDPFVLDTGIYRRMGYTGNMIRDNLIRRIFFQRANLMDGIFDAVASKESIKEINNILDKVVDGEIRSAKDGMQYISFGHEEPVSVMNLSAGIKGFVLIKTLLERGILKEKDVLILDEPEIHMHTQWQLVYAEIIVLIQKYFDMTILVTTHSSHFLQAIEYYSKKYKIEHNCNYYLSKSDGEGVIFQNVTENTNVIHSEMVEPSILLDRLEEELEYEQKDKI